MSDSSSGRFAYSYESFERKKKFNVMRFVAFFLIIGGIGAFVFILFFRSSTPEEKVVSITPTPTEYVFPTDSPILSPTASASATPKPANARDKITGLNKAALSIEVQNGSGQVGVASKMADMLRDFGYTIASIGNAPSYDYLDITILIKETRTAYLPLLEKDLNTAYTIASKSATLSASASADVVVIVGK